MQFQVQLTHKTLKRTGTELLPLRILVTKQKTGSSECCLQFYRIEKALNKYAGTFHFGTHGFVRDDRFSKAK